MDTIDSSENKPQMGSSDDVYDQIQQMMPQIEENLRMEITEQLKLQYESKLSKAIQNTRNEAQSQL